MIKRILRSGLGAFFFVFFLSFLLVGAVKYRLLSAHYWKSALSKGNVYQLMQTKTSELRTQAETSIKKEARGRAIPKELTTLFKISDQLTADRFRELIETNLDRLFGYFNGKDEKLTLFLPVKEWKLPLEILKQPTLLQLTGQSSPEQVMTALGYKKEQITEVLKRIVQLRTIIGYVPTVWSALLLLVIFMGIGHFLLGSSMSDKITGTAWLFMASGVIAKLMSVGANKLFDSIVLNAKPPFDPWMAVLGKDLIGQFFYEWQLVGMIMGGAGLVIITAVMFLRKQGKIKEEEEKIGMIKRTIAFILGILLDSVILIAIVLIFMQALGGKINVKTEQEKTSVQMGSGSGVGKK
ncbi:MAG: hypothetical protein HZA34_01890 [Candidatus Pacebacteria bacterium]|nr:hypothetical protein [Candidatus Paceibacterota bacterium]